jgi:outer membrane protein OmpA-like peptidoglycan-associated protein
MSLGRRASGTLLSTGLAATMGLGTYWSAHAMESTLADQARVTLEARQLTASVLFAGRDATVWADSPSAREDAIAALRTIPGVRIVVIGEGAPPAVSSSSSSVAVTSAKPTATRTTVATPKATATATVGSTSAPTVTTTPTAAASATTAVATTPVPSASPSSADPKPVTIPVWPAIQFGGGSPNLDATAKAQLVKIAQFLVANPTVKVTLTGHTDMGLTAAERQALGVARAQAAASVLVANGVSSSRITAVSQGGNDPVASNSSATGCALNRRVDVTMNQES